MCWYFLQGLWSLLVISLRFSPATIEFTYSAIQTIYRPHPNENPSPS